MSIPKQDERMPGTAYAEIEQGVRKLAMSLPPSDFGSTRAIQAVAEWVSENFAPKSNAYASTEALRSALDAFLVQQLIIESACRREYSVGSPSYENVMAAIFKAREARAALSGSPAPSTERTGPLKLDTETQVFFYEQDFYVLSNFSAFSLYLSGIRFATSEAAYHYEKFPNATSVQTSIVTATSAHEAFKIAEKFKHLRRADWDDVKIDVMRRILRAKAEQHEYVRHKLLATGDRELIENSWRDDFWGWGTNRDGQNMLGKLWMEIRAELRAAPDAARTALAGVTAPSEVDAK